MTWYNSKYFITDKELFKHEKLFLVLLVPIYSLILLLNQIYDLINTISSSFSMNKVYKATLPSADFFF